ncbi:MAG: hypothetical protein SNG14_02865 [Rikenellaceae bacterium]
MKQQNSRMVAEVNKIIGNALVKDGGLYLPSIGSLSVTTTPPSMGGVKGVATAPKRVVKFSVEERQRSLVTTISERGGCTLQQANQIYNRWVGMVSSGERVEIEGVGVIAEGGFTQSPDLNVRLNPVVPKSKEHTIVGSKSVKAANKRAEVEQKSSEGKRSGSRLMIVLGVVLTVVVAAVAFKVLYKPSVNSDAKLAIVESMTTKPAAKSEQSKINQPKVEQPKAEQVKAEQPKAEQPKAEQPKAVQPKSTSKPEPKPAAKKPQPKVMSTKEIFDAAINQGEANKAKHYKVIYGAFSTADNVVKAIREAQRILGSEVECTVYNHGKSFIVSVYDTADFSDAKRFVVNHDSKTKEKLWIHKR